MLKDYFYYREICDDERMDRYFTRTINIVRDKYKQMLRVESIDFDPLVSKYFEAEYITKSDASTQGRTDFTGKLERHLGEQDITTNNIDTHINIRGEGSQSDDYEKTNTERITDDGNTTLQSSGTTTGYSSTTGQTNLTSNTEDNNVTASNGTDTSNKSASTTQKNAVKSAPMNASGVGVSSAEGKLYGLDFEYASSYAQTDNDSTETSNSSNANNTTSNGTSTTTDVGNNNSTTNNNSGSSSSDRGTSSNVRVGSKGETLHDESGNNYSEENITQSGERKVLSKTGTNTDDTLNSETKSGLENTNEVRHDRYAGRDNTLPQDAMASATHYLMNYSTAFQWLCNKLEPCFIGVYDI